MTGWLAQNTDYLAFIALVAALWAGLVLWLHRTGRLRSLPRIIWLGIVLVLVGGWFLVDRAGREAQANTRQKIELLLPVYAREFERLGHTKVPSDSEGDPAIYLPLVNTQIQWQKLNPFISDIYTFRQLPDNRLVVVVDSETDYNHDGRYDGPREQRNPPGVLFISHTAARDRALDGQSSFDETVYTDLWGTWVSAYVPLHNAAGAVEAVLGVDFEASQWLGERDSARLARLWFLAGVILLLTGPAVVITVLRHELAQRRRTEVALREQSELRRMTFNHAPGGVVLCDLDSRLVEVNESFCRMLGYTRSELIGLTARQITHPEDVAASLTLVERLLAGQTDPGVLEKRYIRKDGGIVHASLSIGLIRDGAGASRFFVGQVTDVTERRRTEAELQARQNQLDTILTNTPIVLYALDAQGRYTLCEGAGLAALGRRPGEAVGQSAFDLYASRPDIIADFRRGLAGETFTSQREYNGAVFELRGTPLREADGRVSGVIGVALDITAHVEAGREKKNIERKLQEVQRLESLGVLAGGVAHDFNNLLTAILGNASLMRLELGENPAVLSNLNQIEQASRTAAGLCQQLLAYAGRSRLNAQELDLSQLVRDTTDLLRVTVGNHARLQFTLAADLPAVLADTSQIRQVLLNVVLNAAEALGRRDGVIEISTRRQKADAAWLAEARTGHDLQPGDYVCLDITDNGPGLSAETQARIFDPFFSTKGSGRGLGLAAALGIMRSHQGALRLTSQPGHGTSFTLAFPVRSSSPPKPEAARPAPGRNWRGHGSVLIVDDEEAVRGIAAQMVAYYGFDVKQAESGQQALELVRERPTPFDLVLLDLTMPGMDGFATFTALREVKPEQRIVIFSGYSAHDARQRFAGQNLNGFLQKPFSADALREILTQVATK